ncbi:MAG: ROK family protein [Polyangiaceae bacterium]|nr:ROK family protein [Polyangiaceae bacterium]MCL4751879.1 ROK family protein [Myxococcales bacterium]
MRVGVDFGGTRIKAGRVEAGRIVASEMVKTRAGGAPGEILDQISELVGRLGQAPSHVGVAIPGEVDATGRCYRLPNVPGFEGVNVRAELEARLGTRVAVENDSTSAALGELLFGHGRVYRSFLVATLGTGVGGGLVIGGALRRGAHGFAAEIGHLTVDSSANAGRCVCGQRGCMEVYAGTRGLLSRYAELGGEAEAPAEIAAHARAGDAAALEVFAGMGRALGRGLAQAQKLLDLDALVFGGGVSASFELIEPTLRDTLRESVFGPPTAEVPLLVSELGDGAGVLGAAHLTG